MGLELETQMKELEKILPTHDIKLFSGRSNNALASEIAEYLGTSLEPITIKNFSDGEIYVQIQDSVRGDDVFIVQPICNPVNENLVELFPGHAPFLHFGINRVLRIDCGNHCITSHSDEPCAHFHFGRLDFTRNHPEIHHIVQGIGHALSCPAAGYIDGDAGIGFLKFFGPQKGHRVERERP